MQVNNILVDESFAYSQEKKNMLVRSDEIGDLIDISDYCRDIGEKISYCDDSLWEVEVQEGISFMDWLFSQAGDGKWDDRQRILRLINDNSPVTETVADNKKDIRISLGEFKETVANFQEYIRARREILTEIKNVKEYEAFMRSCFPNSIFADDIITEMKRIEDFPSHVKEITANLSVLDDEAVELYIRYHDNLSRAMDILSAKLLECSPDPAHKSKLLFPFTYYEMINGEKRAFIKGVTCSPHLKLVRLDSNLRIYFYWCDETVGDGLKVLIGRIGGHPY